MAINICPSFQWPGIHPSGYSLQKTTFKQGTEAESHQTYREILATAAGAYVPSRQKGILDPFQMHSGIFHVLSASPQTTVDGPAKGNNLTKDTPGPPICRPDTHGPICRHGKPHRCLKFSFALAGVDLSDRLWLSRFG